MLVGDAEHAAVACGAVRWQVLQGPAASRADYVLDRLGLGFDS
jgi:hypothetical protein